MRRVLALLAAVALVAGRPVPVQATAYSLLTYVNHWIPPGFPDTSLCGQSGMVDTARNYNQVVSKNYVANSCSGGNRSLPSGYLGTQVAGYRDGAFCGISTAYYSTTNTSAWQLWITLCNNPAGTQVFYSRGWPYGWNGSSYVTGLGVTSPSQNY